MALKRLSEDVQSMIDSSSRINCYKRAVEELVYNSLDAKSTSIAIRINLDERCIQVVDNGHGLLNHDMLNIGKKHMTSKCHDLATLKSVPEYYGYRGMALACIIDVSEELKVISRHESTEQSWVTEFCRGKSLGTSEIQTRPSKGTTIQIKGFLYNLNIQSKLINPIQQLQEIKQFLEQLSLMHNNLSLSLRDNVINEIIFKMHKCKDIYQKIKMYFDIEQKDIKELKVIKDKYKVEAYMNEDQNDIHWIYLNGRSLENSKINTIIEDALNKFNTFKGQGNIIAKNRNIIDQQEKITKRKIPFYIIFLTCPYDDYYLNQSPKKTLLAFQNWSEITKLIERLVKFYYGDDKLKEIKTTNIINKVSEPNDIRDKVKEIMQKVLGKNTKISQMKNGVRGKVTRRKKKKHKTHLSLNKFIPKPKIMEVNSFDESIEKSGHTEYIITNNKSEESKRFLRLSNNSANIINKSPNDLVECIQENESTTKDPIGDFPKNKKLRCTKTTTKYDVSMILNNPHLESNKNMNNQIVHNVYSLLNHLHKANEESINERHNLNKNKQRITIKRSKVVITKSVSFPQALESIYKLENLINKCLNNDIVPIKKFHSRNDLINTILSTQRDATKNTHINNILGKRNYCNDLYYDNLVESPTHTSNEIQLPAAIEYNHDEDMTNKLNHYVEKDDEQNNTIDISINSKVSYFNNNFIINYDPSIDITENPHNRENDNVERVYSTIQEDPSTLESRKKSNNNKIIDCKRIFQNSRFISKKSQDNFTTLNNFKVPFLRNRPLRNKVKKKKITSTVYSRKKSCYKKKANPNPKTLNDKLFFDSKQQENFKDGINTLLHKTNVYNAKKSQRPKKNLVQAILDDCNDLRDNDINFLSDRTVLNCTATREHSNNNINYPKQNLIGDIVQDFINLNVANFNGDSVKHISDTKGMSAHIHSCNKIIHKVNIGSVESSSNDSKCKSNIIYKNSESDIFKDDIINENNVSLNNIVDNLINTSRTNKSITEAIDDTRKSNNDDKITNEIQNNENNLETTGDALNNSRENNDPEPKSQNLEIIYLENNFFNKKVTDDKTFKLTERLNFVPKGMSPIFKNSAFKQKVVSDSNNTDYFSDALYKDFEKHVQIGHEIFEANVQNVNELATKEIVNFNHKVKKYNAHIVFDADSLKSVKVLRQVDNKFIAARITTNNNKTNKSVEYLVLFDQHAVHERIRLENNLKEYVTENEWKPKSLDSFTITLSTEEALYLHNYKEKFIQFGLNWTFVNDKNISVNAIPEAIFGKNIRNAEVILIAVKNLIQEQVRAIKEQKGSVSLYPKSIMDLVFSEACRYAIKFGDHLSTTQCMELLTSLQKCKTPFQCAHGRPVLAVLCEIKNTVRSYNINIEKLKAFRKK